MRLELVPDEERTRRAVLGLDLYDEVWDGVYRMSPAPHWKHGNLQHQFVQAVGERASVEGLIGTGPFNLGTPDNYRVPDWGWHRATPNDSAFLATAAAVLEVLSPNDTAPEKLDYYAAHGVEEVFIVNSELKTITCIDPLTKRQLDRSAVFAIDVADIVASIDWP
jgi:Uma2 family endonuclease